MFVNRGDLGRPHEEIIRKDVPLLITSVGILKNESNTPLDTIRPEGRGDYQILYISSGKGTFVLDGEEIELAQGTAVLFRPYEPQIYCFHIQDRAEYCWCHFTGNDVETMLEKCHITPDQMVFQADTSSDYSVLFLQMIRELQIKQGEYNEILELCLRHLLLLLNRGQRSDTSQRKALGSIKSAIGHFYRNYNQNIKVMDFAERHLVSPSWFAEHFKEATGCSPQQFIIQLRITNAMHMLDNTEYTVSQVASAVGYTNTQYFHRLFQKHTGMTPMEYRNRMKSHRKTEPS